MIAFIAIENLPAVNASLNALAAALLVVGFAAVKCKKIRLHKAAMLSALATSAVFLGCYLTYHFNVPSKKFPSTDPTWRTVYFAVLIPHVILAVAMLPFIARTFFLAFRNRFDEHKRLARYVFPVWLYVSVTGVVVYWMLYRVEWT
ncbi:MAG: DUF420 domain-containing protein [Planctomycetia bacterium]